MWGIDRDLVYPVSTGSVVWIYLLDVSSALFFPSLQTGGKFRFFGTICALNVHTYWSVTQLYLLLATASGKFRVSIIAMFFRDNRAEFGTE